MKQSSKNIDRGRQFDFGDTSPEYAKYRDIYPASMYQKLHAFGIAQKGQQMLDLGTGTGVIPRAMQDSGALFTGIDISPEQIQEAVSMSEGMNIRYMVSPADAISFSENTFDAVTACQCFHYFDTDKVIPEIRRVLKLNGVLCIINMMWLPFEDTLLHQTEQLVLKYNPFWTGHSYKRTDYQIPDWTKPYFRLETFHSYPETVTFTPEAWLGRMRTCRGIGASLPPDVVEQFNEEHKKLMQPYVKDGILSFPHEINIEIYRLK